MCEYLFEFDAKKCDYLTKERLSEKRRRTDIFAKGSSRIPIARSVIFAFWRAAKRFTNKRAIPSIWFSGNVPLVRTRSISLLRKYTQPGEKCQFPPASPPLLPTLHVLFLARCDLRCTLSPRVQITLLYKTTLVYKIKLFSTHEWQRMIYPVLFMLN